MMKTLSNEDIKLQESLTGIDQETNYAKKDNDILQVSEGQEELQEEAQG